jgi:hypothetical protein
MCATDLDDVLPFNGLSCHCVAQSLYCGNQSFFYVNRRGDVHRRREGIVGRLGHVDIVIGMNGTFTANRCAGKLAAPIGNDFIHVHVELRSASSHPNMKRKHVRMFAGDDLVTSLNDESMLPVVKPTARMVCVGRGLF